MAKYTTVPLGMIGGQKKSRSPLWSAERTVNLYTDTQATGRSNLALLPWPGEKLFSTDVQDTLSRGMRVHQDTLYIIRGTKLIRINSFGTQTVIGTVPGVSLCSMLSDGTNLLIRTGSSTLIYNGVTLTDITANMENGQTMALLNNQIIYQGLGNRFSVSDPGDPTTVNGLNYAAAEAVGDDLKQVIAFNERIYLFGERSIEIWYNTTVNNPPFERITQSTTTSVGAASAFSAATSDQALYFVGSDNNVYRMTAYSPELISDSAIASELRQLDTGTALGFVAKIDSQNFYIIQIPQGDRTLAFSEKTNEWITLSSGTEGGRHRMISYAFCYNKHLIYDANTCDVLEWSFTTNDSNGSPLIRQRDSAPINGALIGAPGRRLCTNRIDFMLETGVGNADVENPKIMVSASLDGGRTFTQEEWLPLGRAGDSVRTVTWYKTLSFYDMLVRIRCSDSCFLAIHGASVDLKLDGV